MLVQHEASEEGAPETGWLCVWWFVRVGACVCVMAVCVCVSRRCVCVCVRACVMAVCDDKERGCVAVCDDDRKEAAAGAAVVEVNVARSPVGRTEAGEPP